MDRSVELIARFPQACVWVVGDIMLDEYISGTVDRISPEAPVPVVRVSDSFSRLGGAANVARSLAALGADVRLCGVVGRDGAGDQVVSSCTEAAIDTAAVGRVDDRPTTRKLRVLGHHQQLLRLDWEDTRVCPDAVTETLLSELGNGPAPTAVLLSDYAKGFLTPERVLRFVDAAARRGVPILVDPKGRDLSCYAGATVLKPNLRELEEVSGSVLQGASIERLTEECRRLLETLRLGAVVLTLGEQGMLVVARDQTEELVPARTREVYDVTGAGDTALAVLSLGLSVGASLVEAAHLANAAAGLVVDEVGAGWVGPEKLIDEVRPRGVAKVLDRDAAAEQARSWRRKGRRVVFTNGCFDLMHVGHLSLLREAAAQGDVLVVGLNSDASVARLKGPDRPLVAERDRVAMLAALEFVDGVVVFEEETPLQLIEALRPDVLVKGEDYRIEDVVGRSEVEAYGGRVALVPLLPDRSTTTLVERIRRGRSSR